MIGILTKKENKAYSPFHRKFQFQLTLQLHPWQAYPGPFLSPQGVLNLEHGVNRGAFKRTQTSAITEVA